MSILVPGHTSYQLKGQTDNRRTDTSPTYRRLGLALEATSVNNNMRKIHGFAFLIKLETAAIINASGMQQFWLTSVKFSR